MDLYLLYDINMWNLSVLLRIYETKLILYFDFIDRFKNTFYCFYGTFSLKIIFVTV